MRVFLLSTVLVLQAALAAAQAPPQYNFPAPVERDFVTKNFVFADGESLPELKIHYRTVGTPRQDPDGVVRNGVLILHGTGGTGAGFLGRTYGGLLFGKGQPLDAEK